MKSMKFKNMAITSPPEDVDLIICANNYGETSLHLGTITEGELLIKTSPSIDSWPIELNAEELESLRSKGSFDGVEYWWIRAEKFLPICDISYDNDFEG